jgi:hypothetical protein
MNNVPMILPFGKHKGKEYEFIKMTDISYCNWVLTQGKVRGEMKLFQDWLKTVAKKVTCENCNGTGMGHMM